MTHGYHVQSLCMFRSVGFESEYESESESESEYFIYPRGEIVSFQVLLVSIEEKKQKEVCK